jgi:uncharacterized damage-inducible protein DinB
VRTGIEEIAMQQVEVWLRGPIAGVNSYLMPAAHALVQALEDVTAAVAGLTVEQTWARPAGVAAIGYHLRHMAGGIDRLHTYARGLALDGAQNTALARERDTSEPRESAEALLPPLRLQVEQALDRMRAVPVEQLLEPRKVGAKELPSTVIGLLFHAAEHTQRHAGQVVTTARIARGGASVTTSATPALASDAATAPLPPGAPTAPLPPSDPTATLAPDAPAAPLAPSAPPATHLPPAAP